MNPYHAVMADQAQGYVPIVRDGSRKLFGILAVRNDSPLQDVKELDGAPSEIPIIGYSASAFDEDREKCINAGMTAFLAKPLARDKLLAELDRLEF